MLSELVDVFKADSGLAVSAAEDERTIDLA